MEWSKNMIGGSGKFHYCVAVLLMLALSSILSTANVSSPSPPAGSIAWSLQVNDVNLEQPQVDQDGEFTPNGKPALYTTGSGCQSWRCSLNVLCLDAATGEILWNSTTNSVSAAGYAFYAPLTLGRKFVIFSDPNEYIAFDKATGQRMWVRQIGPRPTPSNGECCGGGATVTRSSDSLYGKVFLQVHYDMHLLDGKTGGIIASNSPPGMNNVGFEPPIIVEAASVVAFVNWWACTVYAYDMNLKFLWNYTASAKLAPIPPFDKGRCLMARIKSLGTTIAFTFISSAVGLDALTGAELWVTSYPERSPGAQVEGVFPDSNVFLIESGFEALHAVSAKTGVDLWVNNATVHLNYDPILLFNGLLYIEGSRDLMVVDPRTGNLVNNSLCSDCNFYQFSPLAASQRLGLLYMDQYQNYCESYMLAIHAMPPIPPPPIIRYDWEHLCCGSIAVSTNETGCFPGIGWGAPWNATNISSHLRSCTAQHGGVGSSPPITGSALLWEGFESRDCSGNSTFHAVYQVGKCVYNSTSGVSWTLEQCIPATTTFHHDNPPDYAARR